jgi:hypothetical protein
MRVRLISARQAPLKEQHDYEHGNRNSKATQENVCLTAQPDEVRDNS